MCYTTHAQLEIEGKIQQKGMAVSVAFSTTSRKQITVLIDFKFEVACNKEIDLNLNANESSKFKIP